MNSPITMKTISLPGYSVLFHPPLTEVCVLISGKGQFSTHIYYKKTNCHLIFIKTDNMAYVFSGTSFE